MVLNKAAGLRLILDYLLKEGFYRSFVALEQESKVKLRNFGPEISFFYDLVMEGMFEEAEKMIAPLESRDKDSHAAILLHIRKEAFLEKVESVSTSDVAQLVTSLKQLEALAGKDEFSNLCYILSLNKLSDHPEYSDWSCWKGRYHCFKESLKYLGRIYEVEEEEKGEITLEEVLGMKEEEVEMEKEDSPIHTKESDRYSLDPNPVAQSPELNQDSEVTEEESKQTAGAWQQDQAASSAPESNSEDRRVYVETLDIVSGTDEASGLDEDGYHPPQDLFQRFDPRSLREVTSIEDVQPIRASAFNSTGDYFVLGTNSKSIKVCSLHHVIDNLIYHQHHKQDIEVVFEMKNLHLGSVYCVDWSKSGRQIATGSNDKTIKVVFCPDFLGIQETYSETVVYSNGSYLTGERDLPDIHEVTLTGHKATVRTLCYHPIDDHILLSGGIVDSEIKVWNTETAQCIQRLSGHNGAIYSIAAAGDGRLFTSVGTDKRVRVWDLRTNRSTLQLSGDQFTEMNAVALNTSFSQLKSFTNYPKQSPQRVKPPELAAVSHVDGMVSLWDLTAGKLQSKYDYHSNDCRAVEFSADGKWLVTASFDATIGVVDVYKGAVTRITDHTDRVVSARWHPYLPIVLSTSADRTARVFCP